MTQLEEKRKIRAKRPRFIRAESLYIKRVSRSGYRRPKGVHNKQKDNKKGNRTQIMTGYGYPKSLRGTTIEGKKIVYISNVADLAKVTSNDVIIIQSTMGAKKKVELIKKIIEKKIQIHLVRDPALLLASLESEFKERKATNSARRIARKEKKQTVMSKSDAKKAKAQAKEQKDTKAPVAEDAQVAEKKEQDKVLISKQ